MEEAVWQSLRARFPPESLQVHQGDVLEFDFSAFGAGIRVPLLIISPFVKPGTVYSKFGTFDSLIAFVEANWRLGSLTERDTKANNLMDAFHFAMDPTPALLMPAQKAPKLSPQQIKLLDRQILEDRTDDDDLNQ